MKKLFLLFAVALLVTACDDFNNPQQGGKSQNSSDYYVKYSVSSTYPYIFSNVKYADVNGTGSMMNYQTRSWTITIGPVKKGFRAYVENERGTATDKIEVSKDGSPFAIKASGQNSASYTINY